MLRFYARLKKTGFGAEAAVFPADLIITPQSWSATDRGGNRQADLIASGSAESLASLSGWLGDRLEIYNGDGNLCWYGVLWDMEISIDRIVVTLSLDNIYNRVSVIYSVQLADGSEESRTTAWVQDANSINRYGKRELLYGLPSTFTNSAEDVRDQLLERFKTASPIINTQGQSMFSARLVGRGLWEKAGAVYFTNPDGLVEHQGESGMQSIGRYLTSTQISFGTLTPGGESDEIHIATGDFLPLAPDDTFTVSGATNGANNGTFNIQGMDASNQISKSGSWVAEATGATVKISWGDHISMDNIAMSFQTDTTWVCTHVAVKLRQVGNPSDSIRVGLYPDSGGVPGTVLTFNETLGSALFSELTWTEFAFATPVTLTAATTYYLQVRRTGAASLANGYEVAIDEDLGYADGAMLLYNGTSWVTRNPDADMPFRIIGEISSTEQLEKAIAAVDDFRQSLIQVDSLIPVRQYSVDDRMALDMMDELLDAGTSTGARLIAWVANDDTVIVNTVPAASLGTPNLVLGQDGRVRYPNGSPYVPGALLFGRYVDVDSLLLLEGVSLRASRGAALYIAESTYDAVSDTLTVSGEGALDPFKALTVRHG